MNDWQSLGGNQKGERDRRRMPEGAGTPEVLRVRLLGAFSVSVDPRTIEEGWWRLRKAAALVELLALEPSHRMHRERVMELLWPELSKLAQANNLRRMLHETRQTLDPVSTTASRYFALRDEMLALCPEGPLWWTWRPSKRPPLLLAAPRIRRPTALPWTCTRGSSVAGGPLRGVG